MIRVKATSIDSHLREALIREPMRAMVHSIFQHALNLRSMGEKLILLAGPFKLNGPDTILVPCSDFRSLSVRQGMDVLLTPEEIKINGSLLISLKEASLWKGDFLCCSKESLSDEPGWVLRKLLEKRRPAKDEAAVYLKIQALKGQELPTIFRTLIGMGPGLTPAGDDFLLGLLSALKFTGKSFIPELPGRTSFLSQSILRKALSGRFPEVVSSFFRALLHRDREGMKRAGQRILGIGASSGRFIVEGILWGLTCCS